MVCQQQHGLLWLTYFLNEYQSGSKVGRLSDFLVKFLCIFFQCSVALTKNITFLFVSLNAFLRSGFITVVFHFSLFPCGKRRHKIKPSIVNDNTLFLVPEFRYA